MRRRWYLQDSEEKEAGEYYKIAIAKLGQQLALEGISEESAKKLQQSINQLLDKYFALRLPWAAKDQDEVANELAEMWEAHFGSMNDPAVQAKIKEAIEAMNRPARKRLGGRM